MCRYNNGVFYSLFPPFTRGNRCSSGKSMGFLRQKDKLDLNFRPVSDIIGNVKCRCDGMVDVTDSKSVGGDTVWVRVPPPAPRCVDERCSTENAARKCGVFTCFRPLFGTKSSENLNFPLFKFLRREATSKDAGTRFRKVRVTRTTRLIKKRKPGHQAVICIPMGMQMAAFSFFGAIGAFASFVFCFLVVLVIASLQPFGYACVAIKRRRQTNGRNQEPLCPDPHRPA